MNTSVLGPRWELLPRDDFNQGIYPEDGWLTQCLPAHWQEDPALADYTGKVVYRHRFTAAPNPKRRHWLRAAGIFYWSQMYLNGHVFPLHEGYFEPQEHEITGKLRDDNTILIEVACPEEHNHLDKRMITGIFSHWDCIDPRTNPGGVWLPVTLEESGVVRLRSARLETHALHPDHAVLGWRASVDSAATIKADLRWTLRPATWKGESIVRHERRVVRGGTGTIKGTFDLPDPRLWWTHDLGQPDLYEATLEVFVGGEVSDQHCFRFGVRTFELRDFIPYLNGVRFLVKGNNYAPAETRIARVTPEMVQCDLALARHCHMNLLRIHAHIDHPALYDAADAQGVLLWQDFPLQWLYRRSILPEARRQARAMVDLLGNHPSIAVWCMHNEPIYMADTSDERITTALLIYFSVFGWSWNREVMDRRLAEAIQQYDPTRPAIRNSGEYAVPGWHEGTDAHFYFGWYVTYGALRGFDRVRRLFPRNLRFVTEFGAQSFPNLESSTKFMPADIDEIDWEYLARYHSFQPRVMQDWIAWRDAPTLADVITLSQQYQIAVNRFFTDRLRLHKYRPTGGIVPFLFADSYPAITWSLLDYWRVPKASYWAMRDALRPQYAWAILDVDPYLPDAPLALPIYVVNDARQVVSFSLQVVVRDEADVECVSATAYGRLAADSLPEIATTICWTPRSGTYALVIVATFDDGPFENRYTVQVGEAVPTDTVQVTTA